MKLLLTGMHKYTEANLKEIKALGYQVYYQENEREKISFDVSEIEVVVCTDLFKANDIKNFKNLKYIQLLTVGFDTMPLNYIKEHNITLTNAKDTYAIPMSEWTILKLLEILKRAKEYHFNQANKLWNRNVQSEELNGKNVLLLGYGNVSKEIIKKLKAFDVNIYVNNRSKIDDKEIIQTGLSENELKDIDIVIVTLPLAENTYHLVNKDFIDKLKDGVVLINLARGQIVNETDLIEALNNNKFLGLGLDVFEVEPLPKTSPLWTDERVYLTPHYSYFSEKMKLRQYQVLLNRLKEIKSK